MKPLLRPTSGPSDWQALLAEEKHWKPGFSAHALAHCWEAAGDLPAAVRTAFQTSDRLRDFELLLAIPEVHVDLPGGSRPSQSTQRILSRRAVQA